MTPTKTIESYLQSQPLEVRKRLSQIRATIRKVAPKATEGIKWSMPSFSMKRILVIYGGFKNHIGFYPTPSTIQAFSKELKEYKHAPGSVQFPHDQPLPLTLIAKMTKFRLTESLEDDRKWIEK
ncbi:MAG: DUF1801 domain-containing protein [Patescibacteria group bacterium]